VAILGCGTQPATNIKIASAPSFWAMRGRCNVGDPMPDRKQLSASAARQAMYAALRRFLAGEGFAEVETPILIPAPGMEPHITACEVEFKPETDVGAQRTLYLHTSPEYAMKRLLADGMGSIFQICKVFRNGEVSRAHNPEFTMLEFYR